MKTKVLTWLVLLFLLISCNNSEQESSKILGTWRLSTYKYGEREKQTLPDSVLRIKLINQTHFTWVQYMSNRKIVSTSAGGSYTLEGENYTERIDFAGMGMTPYLGKKQIFKLKFDQNKMYLSGNLSDNLKIEEVWIKLE